MPLPIGFKHSDATKRKMRLKKLGENNSFFGKHHKTESKIKIGKKSKGRNLGEKHGGWKGDNITYVGLHEYLRKHLPKPEACQKCNQKKKLELANMTGIYKRDSINWKYLCLSCHRKLDYRKHLLRIKKILEYLRNVSRICSDG